MGKARQEYNLFALTFGRLKFAHHEVNSVTCNNADKCNTEFTKGKSSFSV